MSMTRKIEIDGKEVPFRASAAVPRIYRIKFHRDIYKDLADLEKSVGENSENGSGLDMFSLEMFENIAYIMAKHAAPPLCRIAQKIGWTASTPSPSTKCCRSSLSCGG